MSDTTISAYLIHRLRELGARHVFGVPGDYVLGFSIELMPTTSTCAPRVQALPT